MKRKTNVLIKTEQQIKAEKKECLLRSLIDAALERYEADELLNMFLNRCEVSDKMEEMMLDNVSDDNLKNKAKNLYDSDELKEMIKLERGVSNGGGLYIAGLNLAQEMMLEDFVNSNIYPYHADQQQNVLFC